MRRVTTTGLPGPRPGKDEQRGALVEPGFSLLIRQAFEVEMHGGATSSSRWFPGLSTRDG